MSYFHPIPVLVLQTFLETLFFPNLKGARLIYDSKNLARIQKDIKLLVCNLICSLKKLNENVCVFFNLLLLMMTVNNKNQSQFLKLPYDQGQHKTEQLYY